MSGSTRHRAGATLAAIVVVAAATSGSSTARPEPADGDAAQFGLTGRELRRIRSHSPLPDPPPDPTNPFADDPAAARFGQALFFDQGLSADGSVSCATCHDPALGFSDGKQLGRAMGTMTRHSPALWNMAHNRWFFWDGRADTLWAQALDPIENPREHGTTRVACAHRVHDDPRLRRAYESIFGPLPDLDDAARFPQDARPVSEEPSHPHHAAWTSMSEADRAAIDRVFSNLGKAIAAYVRKLVSTDAPFDAFVAGLADGDEARLDALSPAARRGLRLFVGRAGCRTCHGGPNFTDGEFHNTGVPPLGGGRPRDAGRYDGVPRAKANPFNAVGPNSAERDGAAADKVESLVRSSEMWGQFKTPSLRNVALSPPYMHQGQFATLEDVVRYYSTLKDAVLPSHHQEQLLVPLNLSEEEIRDLVAFLRSLTGREIDPDLRRPPDAAGDSPTR